MISVVNLARPLARAVQGSNRVAKVSRVRGVSSRPFKAVYAKPSALKRLQRMYSNVQGNGESHPPGIMTVDKWGVQREASEMANETAAESEPSTHLPATDMPIFDITRGNFQETLQSRAPVIIMAYLPSSETSAQLDELLQRRVMEEGGAVRLGRLNASVEQELAVALKLTRLPTVLGVFGGRMVSSFVGVPEGRVLEEFFDVMLRFGGHEELAAQATKANAALAAGDVSAARDLWQQVLHAPHLRAEAIALAGLIRCAIHDGAVDEAQEIAEHLRANFARDLASPEVQQALTSLELASAEGAVLAGGATAHQELIQQLKRTISESTDDAMEARLHLAQTLWATSQQQEAIDTVFDMIKKDKYWNEQAARKLLLKFWESLGPDHDLTSKSRKRFALLWF